MRLAATLAATITLLLSASGAAVAAAPLVPRMERVDHCSWDRPGHNPFMGDVVAAIDRYTEIPTPVRMRLKQRMQARQYDDLVDIRRDEIRGRARYEPAIRDMHFGLDRVCRQVSRAGWTAQMHERGLVYCEAGHCILVPTVCRNVSRIERLPSAAAEVAASGTATMAGATQSADGVQRQTCFRTARSPCAGADARHPAAGVYTAHMPCAASFSEAVHGTTPSRRPTGGGGVSTSPGAAHRRATARSRCAMLNPQAVFRGGSRTGGGRLVRGGSGRTAAFGSQRWNASDGTVVNWVGSNPGATIVPDWPMAATAVTCRVASGSARCDGRQAGQGLPSAAEVGRWSRGHGAVSPAPAAT